MWSEVSEGYSDHDGFAGITAMVLGAIFVLLVLTVVIGALLWGTGKLGRGGEGRTRGLWMVCGSLAGAVIVGTSATAVAWSSTAGGTEGGLNALMPEDARPGETRIEVEDVLVNCQQPVSWEADTDWWAPKPSDEEDAHGRQLLEELGVLEDFDERTGSESWLTNVGDMGGVVSVAWQPAGGDCSTENRTAIGDSTITAEVHVGGPNITGSATTHDVELKAPESDDGDSGSSD